MDINKLAERIFSDFGHRKCVKDNELRRYFYDESKSYCI